MPQSAFKRHELIPLVPVSEVPTYAKSVMQFLLNLQVLEQLLLLLYNFQI